MSQQTERERDAAFLVSQALGEIDDIVAEQAQQYADLETNVRRGSFERRKFTLKDAKPKAKRAADLLRRAWEILDPCNV